MWDIFETPPAVPWFLNWLNHWVINLTKIDSRHYTEIFRQVIIYLEKAATRNNLLESGDTIWNLAKVFLESCEGKALWGMMNEKEQLAWQKTEHQDDQVFEERELVCSYFLGAHTGQCRSRQEEAKLETWTTIQISVHVGEVKFLFVYFGFVMLRVGLPV